MTDAYAAPEDRIALDTIVARLNVERFSKMYSGEADETKRQILAHFPSGHSSLNIAALQCDLPAHSADRRSLL